MRSRRRSALRVAVVVALFAILGAAWSQTRVNGTVGACAQVAPADLVAEARAGLAWFPVEVGRGSVGADGSFALAFHDAPYLPDDVTVPLENLFAGQSCEDLIVSEPEARVVMVRELRIVPRGAACEYCETLGTLYAATKEHGSLATTGDVEVRWIHADRPATVTGRCTFGWGQETYEIELAAGWNTVVFETVGVAESIGYCDCRDVHASVQPFPRAQVAWHFVSSR